MISLKVALVSAAAVGTVAAGGVTYATVGYSQSAPTVGQKQLPSASVPAKPSMPGRTDCLPTPATPKLPAKAPTGAPTDVSGKVPSTVPTTFPTTTTVPTGKVPSDAPAKVTSKVPASAPTCLGNAPTSVPTGVAAPTGAPTSVPTEKVPGLSAPAMPKLDCSQVPSVVQAGSSAERSLALPNGLQYDKASTVSHTFKGRKICEVGQTWKNPAGQWIKLERFKGEATVEQIRQAMQLPEAKPASVGGMTIWQSPLGSGQSSDVMWSPEPGVALLVGASPAYTYQLQGIATRLQQIGH
jgi:hypothetical protein